MMRNLFFAAVATLAVIFTGPVHSGRDPADHRATPPLAVLGEFEGNG